MRNIKYLILTIVLSFFTGCQDDLENSPSDALLPGEVLSSVDGFRQVLNGTYKKFMNSGYFGDGDSSDWIIVFDVTTDNLILNPDGRQTNRTAYEWRYNANNFASPLYYRGYDIIEQANFVLNNIDLLDTYTDDESIKNNIEGQGLAIRGLVHFDLIRTFAKIPTQSPDANGSIGLHYNTVYDPFVTPARDNTVGEFYQKVLADLNTSVNLIADSNPAGFLDKAAVYGILSRVYLHMGEWELANTAADNAIAQGAQVADINSFPGVWTDATEDGVLFKLLNAATIDDLSIGVPYNQSSSAGIRSEYVVDYELYQLYGEDDVRKDAYFQTAPFSGNEYNNVIKYFGRETGNLGVVDGKYLRSAEVYLNKAEALYKLGRQDEALAALNAVRSERYENFDSSNETGQLLYDAILLERRLELAFEGDRFFTLKRLGLPVERSSYGQYADGSGTPAVYPSLDANSYLWQWPIPQDALNLNPNATQNEGY